MQKINSRFRDSKIKNEKEKKKGKIIWFGLQPVSMSRELEKT